MAWKSGAGPGPSDAIAPAPARAAMSRAPHAISGVAHATPQEDAAESNATTAKNGGGPVGSFASESARATAASESATASAASESATATESMAGADARESGSGAVARESVAGDASESASAATGASESAAEVDVIATESAVTCAVESPGTLSPRRMMSVSPRESALDGNDPPGDSWAARGRGALKANNRRAAIGIAASAIAVRRRDISPDVCGRGPSRPPGSHRGI
jgi:hypothetical protein